jgi:hypothetical protein
MTAVVFACRAQRVVAGWQTFAEAAHVYAERVTDIVRIAAAGTVFTAVWEPCAGVPGRFTGIAAGPGHVPLPGWRAEGPVMVPDPDRAAGRWAAAELATAGHPGDPQLALPGLPAGVTRLAGFTATLDGTGTALVVSWDCSEGPAGPATPGIWEHVGTGASDERVMPACGGDRR